MNILDQFEHQNKKQNKEHFSHLIFVALADGTINETEKEMLFRLGRKLNFTDTEIESLIESTKTTSYSPHYELSKRFEQMYDIMKMVLADNVIDNSEMRLATGFAIKSGFLEEEISTLLTILIHGIKNGEDEETLFMEYKKTVLKKSIK